MSKIPRLVQVQRGFFVEREEVGKIYDTSYPFPTHLAHCEHFSWEEIFKEGDNNAQFFIPIYDIEVCDE